MSMLVDTQTLAQQLDDPEWVVLDTRHDLMDPAKGQRVYAEGHIPGAHFLSIDHDLAGTKSGTNGRHPLPDLEALSAKLSRAGVSPGRKVVVYDDAGGNYALRAWWLLHWLGHDDVAVLDGQYPAWLKGGHPVSREVPTPRDGKFVARPRLGGTVDAAFLERFSESADLLVLDARNAERFEGKAEPIDPVAGHIPGAVNRFWQANLGPDGRFKAPAQLRAELEPLLKGTSPVQAVHYCGSGVTACHNLFAMELAGLHGSRLYPGSWSEWCADPGRAIAKGP